MDKYIYVSTVKCPSCGFERQETMLEGSTVHFYLCHNCDILLKTKEDECCIFCSYGSVPCPPNQETFTK